jgi:hypothetical protein
MGSGVMVADSASPPLPLRQHGDKSMEIKFLELAL